MLEPLASKVSMSGFSMTEKMIGSDRTGYDRLSTGNGKFAMKVGRRTISYCKRMAVRDALQVVYRRVVLLVQGP